MSVSSLFIQVPSQRGDVSTLFCCADENRVMLIGSVSAVDCAYTPLQRLAFCEDLAKPPPPVFCAAMLSGVVVISSMQLQVMLILRVDETSGCVDGIRRVRLHAPVHSAALTTDGSSLSAYVVQPGAVMRCSLDASPRGMRTGEARTFQGPESASAWHTSPRSPALKARLTHASHNDAFARPDFGVPAGDGRQPGVATRFQGCSRGGMFRTDHACHKPTARRSFRAASRASGDRHPCTATCAFGGGARRIQRLATNQCWMVTHTYRSVPASRLFHSSARLARASYHRHSRGRWRPRSARICRVVSFHVWSCSWSRFLLKPMPHSTLASRSFALKCAKPQHVTIAPMRCVPYAVLRL